VTGAENSSGEVGEGRTEPGEGVEGPAGFCRTGEGMTGTVRGVEGPNGIGQTGEGSQATLGIHGFLLDQHAIQPWMGVELRETPILFNYHGNRL
jgi:hypothetical protein